MNYVVVRFARKASNSGPESGGGQNLERPNVERPKFRKFTTSNIEITKVE